MSAFLRQLSLGLPVEQAVALVVAHPDDEILALGSRLSRLQRLKIIHLTDGAPRGATPGPDRDGECRSYAAGRKRELQQALCAAGAGEASCLGYDYPDQQAIGHCEAIVERLSADLQGTEVVVTHPYEHGHPDHDTAALAVSLACQRLGRQGRSVPKRYEFASYHLRAGEPAYGVFWPDPRAPELRLPLSEQELERKRAATDCFASQRQVIARFPIAREQLRPAPRYDFCRPAPPGLALYDRYEWPVTSARWRETATRVVARNGARPAPCS